MSAMINIQKHFPWLIICVLLIYPAHVIPVEKISLMQSAARPTYVSDELLVKFKSGVAKAQQSQIVSALGVKEIQRFGKQQRFSRIKLQKDQSMQQVLAAYRADPTVEYVQPNYIYYAQAVPDDTEAVNFRNFSSCSKPCMHLYRELHCFRACMIR